MAAPAMAQPRFGAYDDDHVWRDPGWWHSNHPEWMYSYHPEWVVERRDWWWYDHQYHPEWFWAPFWGSYPLWTWGAPYQGTWYDYWWWHRYHPDWMYANHPEWAEPYGRWMRDDYRGHPEWFASNYWREHPRDWANPDRDFWHREDGRFKDYISAHPEHRSNLGGPEHAGTMRGPEHAGTMRGPEHAGGLERGTHPGGEHPNEHARGETHNAPHPEEHHAAHPESHPAEHHEGGGAKGGERER
jgi:hypothetical protein